MLTLFLLSLSFFKLAFAGFYQWDITWVANVAPDGFKRPVIGVNGKWPPPVLQAEVGERITVVVCNKLGNETTSLHWHGIRQLQSGTMEGPSQVAQCGIPPGATFTYSFIVPDAGTYWWHSHNAGQYPDGLRGPLIVNDKNAPWKGKIAKEYTITLSEWYHKQMPDLISEFQSTSNKDGAEPIPDSMLINDGEDATYPVEAGKTYFFRILNIGAFPSFFFNIADHEFQVVEMDGQYTVPTTAKTLYIGAAMRYGILVTAKKDAKTNFDISAIVDKSMFHGTFKGNSVVSASLQYDAKKPQPKTRTETDLSPSILSPLDDLTVPPLDGQKLLGPVSKQIVLNTGRTFINGIPRAIINNTTYLPQKVPSLYTALTVGRQNAQNPKIYGVNSNAIALNYNDIIEVVIYNQSPLGHPWHLHGHKFQVISRSPSNTTTPYTGLNLPSTPTKRDVVGVQPGGYLVLRFRADNPGINLLHCHIEWHVQAGLTATFIEAADRITYTVPLDHMEVCRKQGIPTSGNAAGNLWNLGDLRGANTQVPTKDFGALVKAPNRRMIRRAGVRDMS